MRRIAFFLIAAIVLLGFASPLSAKEEALIAEWPVEPGSLCTVTSINNSSVYVNPDGSPQNQMNVVSGSSVSSAIVEATTPEIVEVEIEALGPVQVYVEYVRHTSLEPTIACVPPPPPSTTTTSEPHRDTTTTAAPTTTTTEPPTTTSSTTSTSTSTIPPSSAPPSTAPPSSVPPESVPPVCEDTEGDTCLASTGPWEEISALALTGLAMIAGGVALTLRGKISALVSGLIDNAVGVEMAQHPQPIAPQVNVFIGRAPYDWAEEPHDP